MRRWRCSYHEAGFKKLNVFSTNKNKREKGGDVDSFMHGTAHTSIFDVLQRRKGHPIVILQQKKLIAIPTQS
jgi:hypothetical protein